LEGANGMLPERLRELRIEAGLSQEQLAGILSLHKSTISLYENGRREPDAETMQRIAAHFRVSVDYLLGRTDVRQHNEAGHPTSDASRMPSELAGLARGTWWLDLEPEDRQEIANFIEWKLSQIRKEKQRKERK